MRASLRRLGNSRGVILPKPVLAQLGIEQPARRPGCGGG
jgi:antitoxin component of MazEF toxin-antitoxin module